MHSSTRFFYFIHRPYLFDLKPESGNRAVVRSTECVKICSETFHQWSTISLLQQKRKERKEVVVLVRANLIHSSSLRPRGLLSEARVARAGRRSAVSHVSPGRAPLSCSATSRCPGWWADLQNRAERRQTREQRKSGRLHSVAKTSARSHPAPGRRREMALGK